MLLLELFCVWLGQGVWEREDYAVDATEDLRDIADQLRRLREMLNVRRNVNCMMHADLHFCDLQITAQIEKMSYKNGII